MLNLSSENVSFSGHPYLSVFSLWANLARSVCMDRQHNAHCTGGATAALTPSGPITKYMVLEPSLWIGGEQLEIAENLSKNYGKNIWKLKKKNPLSILQKLSKQYRKSFWEHAEKKNLHGNMMKNTLSDITNNTPGNYGKKTKKTRNCGTNTRIAKTTISIKFAENPAYQPSALSHYPTSSLERTYDQRALSYS